MAATLCADAATIPVHLRNMSRTGALVEAGALPEPGTEILLRRGQLQAKGKIAWRFANRAGVKLDTTIHVTDWMARLGSVAQQRVDALVAIVRNGPADADGQDAGTINGNLIECELGKLRAELSALEAALVGDVILVATHPEIQALDVACQRIDRILASLRSG